MQTQVEIDARIQNTLATKSDESYKKYKTAVTFDVYIPTYIIKLSTLSAIA